jgi:hypothetical protein
MFTTLQDPGSVEARRQVLVVWFTLVAWLTGYGTAARYHRHREFKTENRRRGIQHHRDTGHIPFEWTCDSILKAMMTEAMGSRNYRYGYSVRPGQL